MDSAEAGGPNREALVSLGRALLRSGYRFTTVSPESHRRFLARFPREMGTSLRDAFGWNLPIRPADMPDDIRLLSQEAGILTAAGACVRSRVRFSTIGDAIYLHSAYPTLESDSVFFGPDTYRFVSMIQREIGTMPSVRRVVDIGCGSGAGGLEAIRSLHGVGQPALLELTDVNPLALQFAAVNARLAGVEPVELRRADLYAGMLPGVDLIVANPPYLIDRDRRAYRHGGGSHGAALSQRIVSEGLPLLAPGGMLLLYTGSVVVGGRDLFFESLRPVLEQSRMHFHYAEIDPDVFGEELDDAAYADAERIAVVSLVVQAPKDRE
ncbi:methyltransferase [Variovorax sp. GT1P44]|uniref:methyltransferase n=1 Tax=Variovorax sp. GT1P44 TaxID=3443742 RepID=UPI003F4531B8